MWMLCNLCTAFFISFQYIWSSFMFSVFCCCCCCCTCINCVVNTDNCYFGSAKKSRHGTWVVQGLCSMWISAIKSKATDTFSTVCSVCVPSENAGFATAPYDASITACRDYTLSCKSRVCFHTNYSIHVMLQRLVISSHLCLAMWWCPTFDSQRPDLGITTTALTELDCIWSRKVLIAADGSPTIRGPASSGFRSTIITANFNWQK